MENRVYYLWYFINCILTMFLHASHTPKSSPTKLSSHQSTVEEVVWRVQHLLSWNWEQEEWKESFQEVLDKTDQLSKSSIYVYKEDDIEKRLAVSLQDMTEILPEVLLEYPSLQQKLKKFTNILGEWAPEITNRLLMEYGEDLIYESKAIALKTNNFPTETFLLSPNTPKEEWKYCKERLNSAPKIWLSFIQEWSEYSPERTRQIIQHIEKVKHAKITIKFATIPPEDLENLFSQMHALKSFEIYWQDLKGCSEAQLKAIFWSLHSIKALSIKFHDPDADSIDQYTPAQLSAMFSPLVNLKSLRFSQMNFWNLSLSQLQALRTPLKNLRLLSCYFCDLRSLSEESMNALFGSLEGLDNVNLIQTYAPKVSREHYHRRFSLAKVKQTVTIDSVFLRYVKPEDWWKVGKGFFHSNKVTVQDLDKDQKKLLKKINDLWKRK